VLRPYQRKELTRREGTLLAQRFDLESGRVTGEPFSIAERYPRSRTDCGFAAFLSSRRTSGGLRVLAGMANPRLDGTNSWSSYFSDSVTTFRSSPFISATSASGLPPLFAGNTLTAV
jgi:hypothetical protein